MVISVAAARSRESVPTGGGRDEGGATVLASWDDAACPVPGAARARREGRQQAGAESADNSITLNVYTRSHLVYQLPESDREQNIKLYLLSQVADAARARDKVYPAWAGWALSAPS